MFGGAKFMWRFAGRLLARGAPRRPKTSETGPMATVIPFPRWRRLSVDHRAAVDCD
jgi:hypothetical protein